MTTTRYPEAASRKQFFVWKQGTNELEKHDSINSDENSTGKVINPILQNYLTSSHKNIEREPHGYRYDSFHEFFALFFLMGPYYFEILTSNLIFPTYKTTSTYKKQFLFKYGIHGNLFNGEIQNIFNIMHRFLPDNFDGKGVIMVDAAYVTPYVQVCDDGKANGLLGITQIHPDVAKVFLENESEFCEFNKMNYNSIIQSI